MGETYTVSVDDASSIIHYHPQGDGGVGNWTQTGWQPYYSGVGGFSTEGGEAASGSSMHITTFPNASLDFQFYGSAVSLFGTANCSYIVSVDGNSTSFTPTHSRNSPLYVQDSLSQDVHNVSLIANASHNSSFAFSGAALTKTITAGASLPTPHVYQATNTSLILYDGNWTMLKDPLIPNSQHPAPYYITTDPSASLSFSFQGVGVAINGSRIWGSYLYNVSLDGQTETYNASTMWFIGDALLYYRDGLDPHEVHTVNVTPTLAAGGFLKFWLNTVTVFTDDPSEVAGLLRAPTSSTRKSALAAGTIAGSVIGGIVFFVLAAAILWSFIRRKRERLAVFERDEPSPFLARAPVAPSRPTALRDTKLPIATPHSGDVKRRPATIPDVVTVTVSHPESGPTPCSSSEFLQAPPQADTGPGDASGASLVPTRATTSHSGTPPIGTAAADPNVAVERIIQLLAERMATEPARQTAHDVGDAPPEYGA
ncbi:uncharacterized protein TRAVEDRAFT_47227 [Trametes versicolor FP-101664 SS1]|uniref:uncharacterized protein n=1 Tax=Trametes versicolor (strain FP-101664) TaxID=717944 RepID=UPI0004623F20|nr:uncharacterized protein TRAVEDRAFT_47227 [Trametes versicolor FP-101664 SS1]EIW59930.1 hypothetical protein TRAVEDRAFT_47227 [Trametes versicolor FP-101664 SS1]